MVDYRNSSWSVGLLTSYGREIAKDYYWKIYVSENIIRVIIHSILLIQIGQNWWTLAVHRKIQNDARRIRNRYLNQMPPRSPGSHDIYCTYLPNLEKIIFDNKGFLAPLLPEIDKLIIGLNRIRLPRNLLGHMNILNSIDRRSITNFHKLCVKIVKALGRNPSLHLQYP
jgi:hypothetical protein